MQLIKKIRQSARLITSLPPDLQRIARDSYSASLKSVFFFAACSTMLAYLVRLPVRPFHASHPSQSHILLYISYSCRVQRLRTMFIDNLQIPDKVLEHRPRETVRDGGSSSPQSRPSDDESGNYIVHDASHKGQNGRPAPRSRRLSMYEDGDAVMDPESGKTRSST
jgi:hypothetical protein